VNAADVAERVWDAGRRIDLAGTLAPLRHGGGDPAHRTDRDGTFWWACATPAGDGTLAVTLSGATAVRACAWGPGRDWLLDRVPALLGASDDWSRLDTSAHPVLHDLRRLRPGLRLPSTGLVLDALVPAVLEQRVTGGEARRSWRTLLYRFGTPAPGPVGSLRIPPTARVLLGITTWDWHRLGVDERRQRAIRAAATVANRLEECASMAVAEARRRLLSVPGIGVWTAAETTQRALGDPDSVSVGDYHLKNVVVHFFTGRARGSDEDMLALLQPWAGSRQRVMRLIESSGVTAPRFGPRYAPLDTRAM
jgi:3-methyladenine DNA glycosylase/8-oxoguanine DNA glycosylase